MRQNLIYDIPLRLFHWLFAGSFIFVIVITKVLDDDSNLFHYHMLVGLTLGFLVVLRIIWGILGTQYSRFSSFALSPKELLSYLKSVIAKKDSLWAGHNPASSWAALTMFALTLGLGTTGYLMTSQQSDSLKEIHELFANLFLLIVIAHVVGVLYHGFRHSDAIALSMVTGKKQNLPTDIQNTKSNPVAAALFIGFIFLYVINLSKNYNSTDKTLHFFGTTLHLAEEAEHEKSTAPQNTTDHETEDSDDN